MSWMTKLYETYETIADKDEVNDGLEFYYHKREPCHIEIIIDDQGNFIRAESLITEVLYGKKKYWKGKTTIIPVTPKSLTGRTSGPAPYPLAEQIQYIAKDYPTFGGTKKSYFDEYFNLINSWAGSGAFSHSKVRAVTKYVQKGNVVRDLLETGILYSFKKNGSIILITKWAKQAPVGENKKKDPKPPLLNAVSGGEQGNAKIRWRVQRKGEPDDKTWNDKKLISQWQSFQEKKNKVNGFCQLLGTKQYVFNNHPKGIVPRVNDAKLISAPSDKSYLTYQGRFTKVDQPCGLSFEVSQKAHNILRWLIERQGYHNDEQVFVTWAASCKPVPEPFKSSIEMFGDMVSEELQKEQHSQHQIDHSIDFGNSFANNFNKYLNGYLTSFELNEQIMVIGLDSATTGRMSVIYYRELLASEFLDRLHKWHQQFAWPQRVVKEFVNSDSKKKSVKKVIWPISSPIPRVIAEVAYGSVLKSKGTLKKSLLERLLPCIIDEQQLPRDIMVAAVRRVSNRNMKRLSEKFSNFRSETTEWEKHLGVVCALFKGYYLRHPDKIKRREYAMALEEKRTTRDYLYGRLLAIADYIESQALRLGGENRLTTAARLMQRFADRPFSTWRNIELGLQPYMQRLQVSRTGFLVNRKKEFDFVQNAFEANDFTSDKPLSGEFLLGYHCQIQYWRNNKSDNNKDQSNKENNHES